MRLAIEEARNAVHLGEVPVGAVLAIDGEVVAAGFNQPVRTVDPTAHAELVALRKAARAIRNYRLTGSTMYVTIEPCIMCVGAMLQARISTLVYGADDPKGGAIRSIGNILETAPINHRYAVVSGVLEPECRKLLREFFRFKRQSV